MSKLKILFTITIIYPIIYIFSLVDKRVDASFANIYFLFVFIITILLFSYRFKIVKKDLINILLLNILIFINIFNFTSLRFSKPLFFFIMILFIYLFINNGKLYYIKLHKLFSYKFTIYIVVLFSLVLSLLNYGYTDLGRFKSFLISPTLFSVFLDVLFIFFLVLNNKKYYMFFLYLIMLYLHFKSETRLNLIFILFIPIVYIFIKNMKKNTKIIFIIVYIITLNFIYPIYQYYSLSNSNNVLSSRYEDGRDASFGLRLSLFNTGLEMISSAPITEVLFGKGSEYTRTAVINKYGQDLLLHNDFIRFIIDFGIIAMIIYIYFLIRLAIINNLSYLLVMLYFLTFYHNMIYSYYLLILIMISTFININSEDNYVSKK